MKGEFQMSSTESELWEREESALTAAAVSSGETQLSLDPQL